MNIFQTMCKIMKKTNTFLGIVAGVNECSLVRNSCLLVGFLAFCWL